MMILRKTDAIDKFKQVGGGKAFNLAKLTQQGFTVPDFFCVTSVLFEEYLKTIPKLPEVGTPLERSSQIEKIFLSQDLSAELKSKIEQELDSSGLSDRFIAVRSSGLDEDSADHSFAGQFSSYMYQKGMEQISESLRKCWASAYSERALSYRIEKGLGVKDLKLGVVFQLMVNSESSGVAFSRNPVHPADRNSMLVSSVWGQCEGLVSGELDADTFEVDREKRTVKSDIVPKTHALYQNQNGGLIKKDVESAKQQTASLTPKQIQNVCDLVLKLESQFKAPQDCEWAFEGDKLYFVQTRPITTLPTEKFYDTKINGEEYILWDNSNIIESYSGVTTPLTFSFASYAYRQVYIDFHKLMGVPQAMIDSHEIMYRNMLGLIRGRVYYNLINWYRLVIMLPGSATNKAFMETMMGVKDGLTPEVAKLFEFMNHPPHYGFFKKIWLFAKTLYRFIRVDTIVGTFQSEFDAIYQVARKKDYKKESLSSLSRYYQFLEENILAKWQAPIINDYLCMIFFGLLKMLTQKWVMVGDQGSSLQNDLLCGQGDLESTEPTKTLMRIADKIDNGDAKFRTYFLSKTSDELVKDPEVMKLFADFLDRYGFRCINELKLEEEDLHDNPNFAIQAAVSYVKMKAYSIADMERREKEIKDKAEKILHEKLSGPKLWMYKWVLKQTRKAVRNRENLRFLRTKIFGVCRHIFRAMGHHFHQLGLLSQPSDVFYLTTDELLSFIEGRPVSLQMQALTEMRKKEFEEYKTTADPPERLLTQGAASASFQYPLLLSDLNLIKVDETIPTDPNILMGTPCCPGIIEGVVRVVKDAKDSEGINGDILVTERTDPGWVPLYPSCSGLLIERGSLLSHSAVVARELGLPTIVGVRGGLMKKLKTGMRVRVDAGRGEIRILQ